MQLQHHPLLRKTPGEVAADVERRVKETRIWKGTKTIFDTLTNVIDEFIRPDKSKGKGGDPNAFKLSWSHGVTFTSLFSRYRA